MENKNPSKRNLAAAAKSLRKKLESMGIQIHSVTTRTNCLVAYILHKRDAGLIPNTWLGLPVTTITGPIKPTALN